MDRLRYLLVITLVLSYQQIVFAQKNNALAELKTIDKNLNESVFISTNTNSFLTGETLYYKIFCMDKTTNAPTKYTKVAYFELIDTNKKTIVTHKLFLENGSSHGDFFIPTTLETGTYKIIGYTNWMLSNNGSGAYFNSDIYIVNPYKENAVSDPVIDPKELVITRTTNDNISFDLKNKIFNTREQAELKVNAGSDDFLKGNYMISVRKTDGFLAQNKIIFNDYQSKNQNSSNSNIVNTSNFVLPELRGEIISGRITSASEEVKNKKISLSIIGKNYDVKVAKTDEQGKFIFNIEKANPNSNIIVQVLEYNKESYTIEMDKQKEADLSDLKFSDLKFNPESDKNITERLVSSQVENAYYNIKKDSLLTPANFAPFYGTLSKEYKLDDFTRFPTMEETITEVVSGVVFRKNNKNYSLHVFDYDENYESSSEPLVVVDGLILDDLNEFFSYSPKNIYKINVVKGLYYYGAKSFNGVVAFTTKNGDYKTKLKGTFIIRPELLRPHGKKEYFQPDYSDSKNTRIPDYRHQLLWLPSADLTDTTIKFYTSDISGQFEIVLEGFSASGKPVFIREIIEVKKSNSN
ncbi:hypothetical protein GJU43_00455 [Flavobacterium sp. LC2016-23]|uniref:hypothetical protein n=1 Tax=Flavobacterium sp. LC2016-23 TaxID=2666330 RepID=UPI0012AF45C8|nr:hypothetical protein [Flavobacterium sp. LC2016-23]MRX37732.1 hypothetical protein [Flavobacterium sp. LC2016-23]